MSNPKPYTGPNWPPPSPPPGPWLQKQIKEHGTAPPPQPKDYHRGQRQPAKGPILVKARRPSKPRGPKAKPKPKAKSPPPAPPVTSVAASLVGGLARHHAGRLNRHLDRKRYSTKRYRVQRQQRRERRITKRVALTPVGKVARRRRKVNQRKEPSRVVIWAHLESHPCVDCGESDPVVLEFDHRDPSRKSFCIGAFAHRCTLEELHAEIAKCDVRCASCHRRETAKRCKSWRWRWAHEPQGTLF